MNMQDRDKRALVLLGVALFAGLAYWFATRDSSSSAKVVSAPDTVDRAERRLNNLRKSLATVDGKEAQLKQASLELAQREKGLIPGDTANQAQAQLLQIVRRVAKDQTPRSRSGNRNSGSRAATETSMRRFPSPSRWIAGPTNW